MQLKKDKVELENQLEQEQEALVNRLWKRMDKLEAEKRSDLAAAGPSQCRSGFFALFAVQMPSKLPAVFS